jgi:DNA-binding transcriptional MocR family regulator
MVYRYLSRLTNELPGGPAVKLPTLRLLARRLRVSISTVQNARWLSFVTDIVKIEKKLKTPNFPGFWDVVSLASDSDFVKSVKIGWKSTHLFTLLYLPPNWCLVRRYLPRSTRLSMHEHR